MDIFGCQYCAGVGYEDYPTSKIPCRVPGHVKRHKANEELHRTLMNLGRRPWQPEDGKCPYCHANEQCEHWTGLGWSKEWHSGY